MALNCCVCAVVCLHTALLVCVCVCAVGSTEYSMFSDGSGPFTINSVTGQILTTGQLDHETVSTYLLTVRAHLLANSSLFSFAQVATHLCWIFSSVLTARGVLSSPPLCIIKVHTLDIAPLRESSPSTLRYGTCSQGISQFYLHTHTFIHNWNEPYLPLSSQL